MIIEDTLSLASLCDRLSKSPHVSVDTEFIREKTYWSQLCLIQLADDSEAWVIDPLADGLDLTPLLDFMENPNVKKVFHSARQDLEIFYKLMNKLPTPIFDTQIAAMVCGFGDSVGYDKLVQKLLNKPIDKSSRFTDWARRPLSDSQIKYALADVTHLVKVYEILHKLLITSDRHSWLIEEIENLNNIDNYTFYPQDAWKRIKTRNANPKFVSVLREVARWREEIAQRKDVPRNRILRDEAIIEISNNSPTTVSDLCKIRGISNKFANNSIGKTLLKAIKQGLNLPYRSLPDSEQTLPLPRGTGPIIELLKVLLKVKCEKNEVAQKLIANTKDLEKIAAFGEKAEVRALSGWRKHIYGKDALRLRAGNIALVIEGREIKTVKVNDTI